MDKWNLIVQAVLAFLTAIGVGVALFQPRLQRNRERRENASRLRGRIRLYASVLEQKLSTMRIEYSTKDLWGGKAGVFEAENAPNYAALEQTLAEADLLTDVEHAALLRLVRYNKLSPPMRIGQDAGAAREELRTALKVFASEQIMNLPPDKR